jgi:hypothetical protein
VLGVDCCCTGIPSVSQCIPISHKLINILDRIHKCAFSHLESLIVRVSTLHNCSNRRPLDFGQNYIHRCIANDQIRAKKR